MSKLEPEYERGWQRYGFDNQDFEPLAIHGSKVPIDINISFYRGRWQPQISFATIPADTASEAIGMHVHRDVESGKDVEEWYIIISGHGQMTFSNGDVVDAGPGDLLAAYPGTGHSFRAIGEDVKLIVVTPVMFKSHRPVTDYPAEFTPRIHTLEVDDAKAVVSAECSVCAERWERPADTKESDGLAPWARQHVHAA